jgi:hypothetical protein
MLEGGLSQHSCISHDTTNASRCRHIPRASLGQPRVNLGQKVFWVAQRMLMGDQNWAHFNHYKAYNDKKIPITKFVAI